jgi:hypothetical protein
MAIEATRPVPQDRTAQEAHEATNRDATGCLHSDPAQAR